MKAFFAHLFLCSFIFNTSIFGSEADYGKIKKIEFQILTTENTFGQLIIDMEIEAETLDQAQLIDLKVVGKDFFAKIPKEELKKIPKVNLGSLNFQSEKSYKLSEGSLLTINLLSIQNGHKSKHSAVFNRHGFLRFLKSEL